MMMKKISVTSVHNDEVQEGGNHVFLLGQTAKLHSRSSGSQEGTQGVRTRKESLMPPIPSARSSASSRKTSSSRERDGFSSSTTTSGDSDSANSGLHVVGETGYVPLNSRKKSTAEKLSDTGYKLYTLTDSDKLPQILRPKKKMSKGSKRKKISVLEDGASAGDLDPGREGELGRNGELGPTVKKDEDTEESFYAKYGLDLRKQFNMEVTRPYTYSYFPKIQVQKKNNRNTGKQNKKIRKPPIVNRKISVDLSWKSEK